MTSRQDVQKRRAWEARFERFRASGVTVARFCAQERVSANTFYYWAKRIGSGLSSVRTSLSRRSGTSEPGRQFLQHLPEAGNSHVALVRFH